MRALVLPLLLVQLLRGQAVDRPPNIYKWIEENAHICTSIPSNGENLVNFLTPDEGVKCSLCPDQPPNELPVSACAVELSPNEIDVDIGCHPIPELCILELRTRYADFFNAAQRARSGNEERIEDIFMAASNPFETTPQSRPVPLGRSGSQKVPLRIPIPKSTVFIPKDDFPQTTTLETPLPFTFTRTATLTTSKMMPSTTTTRAATTTTTTTSSTTTTTTQKPSTTQTTSTTTSPTTTVTSTSTSTTSRVATVTVTAPFLVQDEKTTSPHSTNSEVFVHVVDADSGPFTTVRADIFSSPSGMKTVPLVIDMTEMANRSRTATSLTSFTPKPTLSALNKEVLPDFNAKLGPKAGVEKRLGHDIWDHKATLPSTTTSYSAPESTSITFPTTRKPCRDSHLLCCFWAVAGECDTNPFWMRIHCAMTCGTCNCSLNEADRCESTGVHCELPTTVTSTTTTRRPTTTTSTTTTTTTATTTTSTRATTLTKSFGRFTSRPRIRLPSWKQRPLPPGPPADRPDSFVEERGEPSARPPFERKVPITDFSKYDNGYVAPPTAATLQPPPRQLASSTTLADEGYTTTDEPFTTTTSTCFNYNRLCQFWADLGECARNPFWMRPNCQRACQSCGENVEDVYAPQPKNGCANDHQLCPFWAFIGECGRNPRWMLKHCRPSCKVC